MKEWRDERGRFTRGNPGGPGRPKRPVELDYLRALTDRVTLEDWAQIVGKVKQLALDGDMKAVEWLAKYLLGDQATLHELALLDARGREPGDEIAERAALIEHGAGLSKLLR